MRIVLVKTHGASRWASVAEAEDHILDYPEDHAHKTVADLLACCNVGGFVQSWLMNLHNRPELAA
ncbi:MAG TPA: hypothetical protein VMC43_03545 [Candidatus Paceibacterota bacterium]|nr:hypothetical protein [Candidatus Paceibacterota bacterium]